MNPGNNFAGNPFIDDLQQDNLRNFCSWLLNFNEYELQEKQMIKYKNGNDIRQ